MFTSHFFQFCMAVNENKITAIYKKSDLPNSLKIVYRNRSQSLPKNLALAHPPRWALEYGTSLLMSNAAR